jgi:hypothetical protein
MTRPSGSGTSTNYPKVAFSRFGVADFGRRVARRERYRARSGTAAPRASVWGHVRPSLSRLRADSEWPWNLGPEIGGVVSVASLSECECESLKDALTQMKGVVLQLEVVEVVKTHAMQSWEGFDRHQDRRAHVGLTDDADTFADDEF